MGQEEIVKFFQRRNNKPATSKEIAKAIRSTTANVTTALKKMKKHKEADESKTRTVYYKVNGFDCSRDIMEYFLTKKML